ncbi:MAG: pyridoxine 5'-phosphate synthase [Pseudomonadales bacterium]
MTAQLSINLNKIALIRNSREGDYPSVTEHARLCVEAGAAGITVHPRSDQRHIRASDVGELAAMLSVEFNIEGNPFAGACRSERIDVGDYPGFMALIKQVKPAQCTLVPDSSTQLTSDHGFDLRSQSQQLRPVVEACHAVGSRVSLFMDADPEQIKLVKETGADRIELYTGPYALAFKENAEVDKAFRTFCDAANAALDCELGVNAGHDLNLQNLPQFAQLPGLLEVSIGHAFTVDCIRMGLANAVAAYNKCLLG